MLEIKFTYQELEMLAEFICGRSDDLKDLVNNMNPNMDSSIRAIKNDIGKLRSLDEKLRPFHKETK